ncbi:MAG: hypothetical protein WCR47_03480, partial [Desulfoplanes sp.]
SLTRTSPFLKGNHCKTHSDKHFRVGIFLMLYLGDGGRSFFQDMGNGIEHRIYAVPKSLVRSYRLWSPFVGAT